MDGRGVRTVLKIMADNTLFVRIISLLVTAVVLLSLFPAKRVHAESQPNSTIVNQGVDFYAYLDAGEYLVTNFTKHTNSTIVPSGYVDADVTIVISRPDGPDDTCTILASSPATTDCDSAQQATQSGVWRIRFYDPDDSRQMVDWFRWNITVWTETPTVAIVPGRVWTNYYSMGQIVPDSTLTVWYQGQSGYRYRMTQRGHLGIYSWLFANDVGIAYADTCLPTYQSTNQNDPTYSYDGSCGTLYKLFFNEPATDLPSEAIRWDGGNEWIAPVPSNPSINSVVFASSSEGSRSGNLTVHTSDFSGPLQVHVDTNNNGIIDGNERVLSALSDGSAISVPFDGNDANGNPIPNSQALQFRVLIHKTAEIHFTSVDVEGRSGGIEVELLNGANAGDQTLYWNDTGFPYPDANRCSVTPSIDGRSGVNSAGGVHGWGFLDCPGNGNENNGVNGSWGDYRAIDDWTYVPVSVTASYLLPAANQSPNEKSLAETGVDYRTTLLAAVAVLGTMAAVAVLSRRKRAFIL